MSASQDIQVLIADIDQLLNQAVLPFPWLHRNHLKQQRQLLERVRQYLATLAAESVTSQESFPASLPPQETAKLIAQEVINQMQHQQNESAQLGQLELTNLQRQRDNLHQEIQYLEAQRQQVLQDFLPTLTSRWVTSMSQQLAQTKSRLEAELLDTQGRISQAGDSRWETENALQLQEVQQNADRLLTSLDNTLHRVLGTLERDLSAYQESLSQGLENLHSLGQEREVMLTTVLQGLFEQLSQASSLITTQSDSQARTLLIAQATPNPSPSAPETMPTAVEFPVSSNEVNESSEQEDSQKLAKDDSSLTPEVNPSPLTSVSTPTPLNEESTDALNAGEKATTSNEEMEVSDEEIITSLTQLLEKAYLMADKTTEQQESDSDYISVSADENLLVSDELPPEYHTEPLLTQEQREQLDEDLEHFEQTQDQPEQ